MGKSHRSRARGLPALLSACLVLGARTAAADEPAPGAAALEKARAAWEKHAYKTAEPAYREALEKGGLAPSEVLEGYVRLGAIRAANGKKEQAIAAFRAAAILDADFALPKEGARASTPLAERARRDTSKIGSLQLSLQAPKTAPADKPFTITVQLDARHVPVVSRLAILARDEASGSQTTLDAKTGESVEVTIPAILAVPKATLALRVDALDRRANRLASSEDRVRIEDPPVVVAPPPPPPSFVALSTPDHPKDKVQKKRGGFWSSPWPYLIGGVALAGAGAAVYLLTRPPDNVSVGAIAVRTN